MNRNDFRGKRTKAHIVTLEKYFEERKRQGLGIPQSPRKLGHPSNEFIAKETDIPVGILSAKPVHELVMRWIVNIGLGETVVVDKGPRGCNFERGRLFEHRVDVYLKRLRQEGKAVPANPGYITHPHLERIASESNVALTSLSHNSMARRKLLKGVAELGLKVRVDDPVWNKVTYGELLKAGEERRKEELKGSPKADQQRYNTTFALRQWLKLLSLSDDDTVGSELLEEFKQKVEKLTPQIVNTGSRRKFSNEIKRWPVYYREILNAKGLPSDFRSALEMVIMRSGLTARTVAALANGSGGVITGWLRGRAIPSMSSFPYLERIEKALKLPPRTLLSLIGYRRSKRFHREDYPEFTIIDGENVPLRNDEYLLNKLRPLLPDDFNKRSMEERQEMADWLITNLIGPTSDWGELNRILARLQYSLKIFPGPLEEEWLELSKFKRSTFTPPGMKRGSSWSNDTEGMRRRDFERIFGALALPKDAEDPRLRGLGLDPDTFAFAMFACPEILYWWILWKGDRRKNPKDQKSEAKFTKYESSLIFIIGGLFAEETGWIRQRPDLAQRLKPIPGFIDDAFIAGAQGNWDQVCDKAYEYYIQFAEEIETWAEEIRDPFEPVLPILESENPIAALKTFAQNIFDDMPDAATAPLQGARVMRDYLIARLLSATGLRSKNIVELTYREDGKGELRHEGDKWVIDIHYSQFKNWRGSFFGTRKKKHNYRKILNDSDGLYDRLEEYIKAHRLVLLQGTQSEILLVASSERPQFTKTKFHRKYRNLTTRYMAYNPYLNRGVPGVKPHGPHAVRDIIATYVIKTTGSPELAAYSICDSVNTIREHYARFLPMHKIHLADAMLTDAWNKG